MVVILFFWLPVLVLTLSYFGISLQNIINSPAGQANLIFVAQLLTQLWEWVYNTLRPYLNL